MSEIKDGGFAFPIPASEHHGAEGGMFLRDYFAAKAMQALIHVQVKTSQAQAAATAYEWADRMFRAREAS